MRRSVLFSFASLLVLSITLLGCSDDGSSDADGAGTTTTASGAGEVPDPDGDEPSEEWTVVRSPDATFVEGDCWWDLADVNPDVTVTCGTVEVPEDWSDVEGDRRVVLPAARLHHAAADAASPPPLVVLHGGPGGSSLGSAPVNTSNGEIVKGRDVILWDQRGAGRSVPSLNCPEREEAVVQALADDQPFADELEASVAAAVACRDRLLGEGIDLDQFHTAASVNDLEALRVAFGADEWNVRGGSYGTRLGLSYAREHPDRVRSLTLDSVYPIDVGGLERVQDLPQDAFDRLFAECDADPACAEAYPDLEATLDAAVASLDADPGVLTHPIVVDGQEREQSFRIVGADFRSGMFAAMYENELIPLLPSIIADVAGGDRAILPVYIDTAVPLLTGQSEGAYYSVDCADTGRTLDGATAEDVGGDGLDSMYLLVLAHTYCDVWDVAPLPEAFNEQAVPDVPTLVFAGTLDPVTPHADSQRQAEAMPDARFVSVPRGGHGVAAFDACTATTLLSFLDDPSAASPDCIDAITPAPFSVPAS